jgi:hypothetical protein
MVSPFLPRPMKIWCLVRWAPSYGVWVVRAVMQSQTPRRTTSCCLLGTPFPMGKTCGAATAGKLPCRGRWEAIPASPVCQDAMRGRTQTPWWKSKRGDRLPDHQLHPFTRPSMHRSLVHSYSVVTPQTRPKSSSVTLSSPWTCRFWNRRRRDVRPLPHFFMALPGLSGIPSCTSYVLYSTYWTNSTLPQAQARELQY